MLEMLCIIPNHIGWMIVGALGAYLSIMGWKLGEVLCEMWKDRHEEE